MKKKNYYTPETKFHQLKAKAAMLAGSPGNEVPIIGGEEADAKGFGSFSFDEDED
jgi:hypothetical protein